MLGIFQTPPPKKERIISYARGTAERQLLRNAIDKMRGQTPVIHMYIGGKEVLPHKKKRIPPPHDHQHLLGYYHEGGQEHVAQSIDAALQAKAAWENMGWENRAS